MSIDFSFNPIVRFMNDLRDYGIEWTFRRYPGLYGGRVDDNIDSERGQARALVSVSILGVGVADADSGKFTADTISRRALPTSMYAGQDHGIYFPPEKGDRVWVSFDHGDSAHPRCHGSWWLNADPNGDPSKSEVPAEFRLDHNGEKISGHPTRRGIKSKYGHGLIFSDESTAPYVALWAGKQAKRPEGGNGVPAVVRQQITLVDDEASAIPSANGASVDAGIYANTNEGLRLELNDKLKTVLLGGKGSSPDSPSDNSFEINDVDGVITIKTKGEAGQRHEVILDDLNQRITITTKGKQSIVIDDRTGNITITATGAVLIDAPGGISTGSGVTPEVPGTLGAAIEKGVGTKLIDFQGNITQNIVGAWASTVESMSVEGPDIRLGAAPASALALCTAELIDWLATHTHIVPPLIGAPLGAPVNPDDLITLGTSASSPNLTTALKGD